MNHNLLTPRPLREGDTIAIVSPASVIDPHRVEGARRALQAQGFKVIIAPHALGCHGSYSGTVAERLADLSDALTNPGVRAVLCSRGGYGCVHLLDALDSLPLRDDPKWLIGFSDVSALHALMARKGIVSVHGSMAKALAEMPADSAPNHALFQILAGHRPAISWSAGPGSRSGVGQGPMLGGNLAVVQALISTPYDVIKPGTVLFIEDIAEPIYKVERIIYQLKLSGVLTRLSGLVVGRFTEYKPDRNYQSMSQMFVDTLSDLSIPIATDAPIGHFDGNMPLLYGSHVKLTVCDGIAKIEYI